MEMISITYLYLDHIYPHCRYPQCLCVYTRDEVSHYFGAQISELCMVHMFTISEYCEAGVRIIFI